MLFQANLKTDSEDIDILTIGFDDNAPKSLVLEECDQVIEDLRPRFRKGKILAIEGEVDVHIAFYLGHYIPEYENIWVLDPKKNVYIATRSGDQAIGEEIEID